MHIYKVHSYQVIVTKCTVTKCTLTKCTCYKVHIYKVHSYKVHMLQSAHLQSAHVTKYICYHKITCNLIYQYVSLDATEQYLSTFTPEDINMFFDRNIVMLSEHKKGDHFTEQIEVASKLCSS